jgi:hypothetical protein
MKLTIVNTSGKNLSLPGPLAAYATGGGLAPGASVTGTVTQAELDRCDGELALLKSKNYLTYTVTLDAAMDDQLEGVPLGQPQTVVLSLTNAQVKALKATPVAIVAAPGAGKVLVPLECSVYLKYGGTNAFTANASEDNVAIRRAAGATLLKGCSQTFLQGTASGVAKLAVAAAAQTSIAEAKSASDNKGLEVVNVGAAEIAGNAGGDNIVMVVLTYRVDTAPVGW